MFAPCPQSPLTAGQQQQLQRERKCYVFRYYCLRQNAKVALLEERHFFLINKSRNTDRVRVILSKTGTTLDSLL